ncbi:hypothetical protein ACIQGO_09255 [Streptomyces shenzhenensis]|uniref:hypothetical protein n=1 Tax=Streptomyces shenzhenensis TaxID=943815 RepID=UPI003825EDAF
MLDVLHRDRVALRIHDGAFSAMDLTARHPRTAVRPSPPTRPTPCVPLTWRAGPSPPWPANAASAATAVRTAVADLMPEHTTAGHGDAPASELPVTLDMPGKVADFLRAAEPEPAERAAPDRGVTVQRGQGYTPRVSAVPAVHRGLPARCQPLDGAQGFPVVPAQRKARREYENRVNTPGTAGP